jgi:hypothetical protein
VIAQPEATRASQSSFFERSGLIFCLVATSLLGISATLHFWKLGSVPPGFYSDESSVAYNAYCIAQTGADEDGNKHPVFFRYGDQYQDPVLVYALVPLMRVFGLQKWAARFPEAVFHLLASAMFAFLVQEFCRNKWLSAISGFVFSVLPWSFPVSRTASGAYTAMLFGMVGGSLWTVRALDRQSFKCAVAAGAAWALAMYSYHAGRPMTVLMLGCFSVAFHHTIIRRWRIWLTLCSSFVCALVPMIVRLSRSMDILTSRFRDTSIFGDHPSLREAATRFASRYADYFSPEFLFRKGDENLRHHTGHGGELFVFLVPLILVGLYVVARRLKTDYSSRFVLLGLLVYQVAAALTATRLHSMRCVNGVIFWALVAVIGAQFLWEKRGIGRNLLIVMCCFGIVEAGAYLNDYFGPFQIRSRHAFNAPYTEALEDCFRTAGSNETIYISQSTFALWKLIVSQEFKPTVYVDILFFGRIEPRFYQQGGIPKDRVRLYNGTISKPGVLLRCNMRWVPMPEDWVPAEVPANLKTEGDQKPRPYLFDNNPEPVPAGAELLEKKPAGSAFRYEIYRVK